VWPGCRTTRDLQFDHIDPVTKLFEIRHGMSWSRVAAELTRCQLLCRKHHEIKTSVEQARRMVVLATAELMLALGRKALFET